MRPTVSPGLENAIVTALAKVPADRYANVRDFIAAASSDVGLLHTAPVSRQPILRRWMVGLATAAAATLMFVAARSVFPRIVPSGSDRLTVDTTRFVLLPLERDETAAPWRDDDVFRESLARWRGISVLDQFLVADALRRYGPIRSTDDAVALASSLGAGRYIRGRVSSVGDAWLVSASLYDVARGKPLYAARERITRDLVAASAAYARLADSLLLRGGVADSVPVAVSGSRSLPAVQAFARAQLAMDDWDLDAADSLFELSVSLDPDFARASLWLAQVRAWRSPNLKPWATVADRASALQVQLTTRERQLATALVMLAAHRYDEACKVYDALSRRNDRDFAAWFGLGQCQRMNRLVHADPRSPSGFAFHSSARRAMEAFGKAFAILPAVHRGYERGAFGSLRLTLLLTTDVIIGYDAVDSSRYFARPAWIGDTLALVPYPWRSVANGEVSATPPGFERALAERREAFRRIALGWSAAYPASAEAKYGVAVALELLGDPAAIDTLHLARRLATDESRRRRLAAAEVLLLVKFGLPDRLDYLRAAAALADSILARSETVSPADADILTQIAMLVGACAKAERFAQQILQPSPTQALRPQLYAEAQALLARIGTGCPVPGERLDAFALAVDREFQHESADRRAMLVDAWLSRSVLLAPSPHAAALGVLAQGSQDPFLRAYWMYARGQRDSARTYFNVVRTPSSDTLTPPTPDVTLPMARLAVTLGDTASALTRLDRTLNSVHRYDPRVLSELMRSGPLVQSAVLRADLGAARGDTAAARRWAMPVAILWSHGAEELQPDVKRMINYVGSRHALP
jgi:hypothetical protein